MLGQASYIEEKLVKSGKLVVKLAASVQEALFLVTWVLIRSFTKKLKF